MSIIQQTFSRGVGGFKQKCIANKFLELDCVKNKFGFRVVFN